MFDAVAARPGDILAREDLAVLLTSLTSARSPLPLVNDSLPGFIRRPDTGALQDCKLTLRAIDALTRVIDAGPEAHTALRAAGRDVADLLALRASLWHGLWRHDLAIPDVEQAIATLPYEQRSERTREGELRQLAAMMHADLALRRGHDAELMARVRRAATNIGGRITNVFQFEATPYVEHAARPDMLLQREFGERVEEGTALGFMPLGWLEDPLMMERFGLRSLTHPMGSPDGSTALTVGGNTKGTVAVLESMLADGRVIGTSAMRGRTHFVSGPWVDQLGTDPMPLADIYAIHQARLRLAAVEFPQAPPVELTTLQGWLGLQEQLRRLRLDFRLREGLTEIEVRGTAFPDPDIAMPIVQGAAREAIEAAAAEARARGLLAA